MDHLPTDQKEHRRQATFYWPVLPAALALAGVIVFIFATFGPPASSSGFVSLLKGLLGPIFPDYIARKEHYRIIPGPGSWLFAFVLGMATGGYLGGLTLESPFERFRLCGNADSEPVRGFVTRPVFWADSSSFSVPAWPAAAPWGSSFPDPLNWP